MPAVGAVRPSLGSRPPRPSERRRLARLLDDSGVRWSTLGLRLDEHPLDFGHFARYDDALREHVSARFPLPAPLTLAELDEFLDERGGDDAVPPERQQASVPA